MVETLPKKIWLTQQAVSPYRIPLFKRLSETPGIEFTLVLLTAKPKHRPFWQIDPSQLPFRTRTVFGLTLLLSYDKQICLNPFFLFKLFRERPDVVICGGFSLATIWCWLFRWLTGTPYVIWTEATHVRDSNVRGLRLWSRRLLIHHAGAIVDAGTQAREYIQSVCPQVSERKLFRAYNCVDNSFFFKEARNDPEFLSKLGLPKRNLLFVGRLIEIKGIPMLLEIYRRLTKGSFPELGLALLGDGPLKESVGLFKQQHQLRYLHLAGWVANEHTALFYGSCDVFMLLSRYDANPLVIFEALAAGIPVICTSRAGNAVDFIVDGVNGYVVNPFDAEEILRRTAEVLSWDAERREQARARSRELVLKANYESAAGEFLDASREAMRGGTD